MTSEELDRIAGVQKGAEYGYNKALEEATHNYNAIIADYDKRIAELEKGNAELQAQIEKLKCCQNCKHCTESVSYKARDGKEKSKICSYGNYCCNKWEIKE